jgi:hypothetical protein
MNFSKTLFFTCEPYRMSLWDEYSIVEKVRKGMAVLLDLRKRRKLLKWIANQRGHQQDGGFISRMRWDG